MEGVIQYFAHSSNNTDKSDWQTLADHLAGVADLAARFAAPFGAERAARLSGLLHDVGKYTPAFQRRLSGATDRVDHSAPGAAQAIAMAAGGRDNVVAQLIAFAVAGHHAGLPDRTGADGSLANRLQSAATLDPQWRDEVAPESPEPMAQNLMPHGFSIGGDMGAMAFQLAFLGRMIFSCLVDADFQDTETFYAGLDGRSVVREGPSLDGLIGDLITRFDAEMTKKQAEAKPRPVNTRRADILAHARSKATLPPGFFTMTVPTGGGKTLASLGFALDHARAHGQRRIIYAIPFTSIIDQTAEIFRDVLGEEVVLEHHAAIDEDTVCKREGAEKLKLAMENWDAPVVVTTNVQLFESLFAARTSRCRKLHNLAGSIIVLDEAQTLPLHLLRPCIAALKELVRNYGVTVVICTATQPALGDDNFKDGLPLTSDRELAPDPATLAVQFRRTRIVKAGPMTNEDLVAALAETQQGLVIVNSRKHALDLFYAARDAGIDGAIHLSTRQYAAHRQAILSDVRDRLRKDRPCRLIATSLVEAGVDIDFPFAWRAQAGLDQIAQANGRCNREGRRAVDDSVLTVFEAPDYPPPSELRQFAEAFETHVAGKFDDWLSPEAMVAYFRQVYWREDLGGRLDAPGILKKFRISGTELSFDYRSVAEEFRMIKSGMAPVIIARDKLVEDAVARLGLPDIRPGSVARQLQRYVVQVPPHHRTRLIANGHVRFVHSDRWGDQFAVLNGNAHYKPEVGLKWEGAGETLSDESLIF